MQLRWLKAQLRRVPPNTTVRILFGPVRGKFWIVGASRNAYWLGLYERDKVKLFTEKIHQGDVVYDIGAHVGYYSLLASKKVGKNGCVIAFEPHPTNLHFLYRHLELNRCQNVRVMEAAVAKSSGTSFFRLHPSRSMGSLTAEGELQVKMVGLDELLSKQELPVPQCLKFDIEGAELLALEGARKLISTTHPKLFVATHSLGIHEDCCALLKQMGYSVQVLEWQSAEKRGELYAE